ncbi:hypothetical protein Nmel_008401, partial [Mimus melanotis]
MASCPRCGQNFSKNNVIYWTKGGTWLHQKLEGICQDRRWLIKEFTEQHPAFCAYGQGAKILVLVLQLLLNIYTEPLVHGHLNVIVGQCSKE